MTDTNLKIKIPDTKETETSGSSQYSPTGSPEYDPKSGKSGAVTPEGGPTTPEYGFDSPGYNPTSPEYYSGSPQFVQSLKFNETYVIDNMQRHLQNDNFYKFSSTSLNIMFYINF